MDTSDQNYVQLAEDYERIEKAIKFIEKNFKVQPTLSEISSSIGLSEYHFQRLFTRWAGISPKQFLQYLTKEHAKWLLEQTPNMLDTAYQAGLSGPSRLHDLFITCEAVTPGEFKNKGAGLQIVYGLHPTPFGQCLIAVTERGICSLKFVEEDRAADVVADLRLDWPNAELVENPAAQESLVAQIFELQKAEMRPPLHLYLRGTNFQLKVWEALLNVPAGHIVTYTHLAGYANAPKASRAVGNAVANNPIAFIIPCHRVIRKEGEFGNYRWGTARKKALLGWEMAHASIEVTA